MGPKTFLAALMCLIIVALMCSPIFLVWHGFTMGGSVIDHSAQTVPLVSLK